MQQMSKGTKDQGWYASELEDGTKAVSIKGYCQRLKN
jgi:hypothetical protein